MDLVFMKRNALETLKSNLPQIYPKYFFLNESTNLWMTEVCGENPFQKFEEVEKFKLAPLHKNLSLGEVDFQNCKIIYSNLKFLTETQAADERLWAGLAHENFYDDLRLRWKMNDVTKADKDIVNQIRRRFFFDGGARRSIVITPTLKIPTNFEMFQTYIKFLKNIFGFIVDGVIVTLLQNIGGSANFFMTKQEKILLKNWTL